MIIPNSEIKINDILPGRGKKIGNRDGNVRFREIVDKHVEAYYAAKSNASKNRVAHEVHQDVLKLSPPGRLLGKKGGGFYEETDEEFHKKIKMALRDRLKAKRKEGDRLKTESKNFADGNEAPFDFVDNFPGGNVSFVLIYFLVVCHSIMIQKLIFPFPGLWQAAR